MQIAILRNVLIHRNPITTTSGFVASFHSTAASFAKWKGNGKNNSDAEEPRRPSKHHVRFTVREKRRDAKKALKDLLYKTGSAIHNDGSWNTWNMGEENYSRGSNKKSRQKKAGKTTSKHSPHARNKHHSTNQRKRESGYSSDECPERVFQARFGNKNFTWSFGKNSGYQSSTSQFDWDEYSNFTNSKRGKEWDTISDAEDDENDNVKQCVVGSSSDRILLGLSPTGPIKIEDVKLAYRVSAKRWHPDLHQGSSQDMATEKFKACGAAYHSLCQALSGA